MINCPCCHSAPEVVGNSNDKIYLCPECDIVIGFWNKDAGFDKAYHEELKAMVLRRKLADSIRKARMALGDEVEKA